MNECFAHSICEENLRFKHARGVSERVGREFHVFYELIYFLGGEAEFISERLRIRPRPETLIVIPKETYHQMVIRGDQQNYCRCVLQFSPVESRLNMICKNLTDITIIRGDWEIKYLFEKLMTAAQAANAGSELLHAVLIILLKTLKEKQEITDSGSLQNEIIRQAISYINRNLNQKILIADIAAACNVSASTLSHVFRNEMNIALHRFILKKRLINAHHKILSGQPACTAALECGFRDYSGFYRQYKKAFGVPPSYKEQAQQKRG